MLKKTKTKNINVLKDEAPEIDSSFLQQEIDQIFDNVKPQETVQEIKKEVVEKLQKDLPKDEIVTARIVPRTHDVEISVRSTSSLHAKHSPYVLDLSEMIARKKREEEKKQKVLKFLSAPKQTKKIVLAGKSAAIMIEAPKKEKLRRKFEITHLTAGFALPTHWYKSVLAYAALCLLIVIPIKGFSYYKDLKQSQEEIIEYASSAYTDLKVASGALTASNLGAANEKFDSAKNNFSDAEKELNNINTVLKTILKVIPTGSANLADAEYLLDTGKQVSDIGQELTLAMDGFKAKKDSPLVDKISFLQEKLDLLIPKLNTISSNLSKVRPEALPEDKREQFNKVVSYLSVLNTDLKEISSLSDSLYDILGKENRRRYLFIFQNNNEIRPTGGFIGSFALVDIDRGEIKSIELPGGGSYSVQGQLLENVVSPEPLHLVNAKWEMQDANWFPDFPTSAEKIKWFYEKSGGPTIDGVIAMNASFIPNLLEITKPIDLPQYGKTLSASNFIEETQKAVEFEYDKAENKPKQILADLAPELLKRIFSAEGEELLAVSQVFKTGLDEKDIQLYFTNEGVQNKFSEYNWTGELKDSSKDYLQVVNANIRGYKTDAFIKQNVNLISDVSANGEITNTVTITREHTGKESDVFGRQSNIDYLRIYVPFGSTLISAQGFSEIPTEAFEIADDTWKPDELLNKVQGTKTVDADSKTSINTEFNKTVFGNWIQTDPGEKQTVILKYKLPFTIAKETVQKKWYEIYKAAESSKPFYSLFLQKQSGVENTTYTATINFPENLKVSWKYPEITELTNNSVQLTSNNKKDILAAFILE